MIKKNKLNYLLCKLITMYITITYCKLLYYNYINCIIYYVRLDHEINY